MDGLSRRVADRVIRAFELRSTEPEAFEMLSIGLMVVRELTATDEKFLDFVQRFLPQSGLPTQERSVSAYRHRDKCQARELHALACSGEPKFPASSLAAAARSMGERWL